MCFSEMHKRVTLICSLTVFLTGVITNLLLNYSHSDQTVIDYQKRIELDSHHVLFSPDIHAGTRRDLAFSLYSLNQSIIFSSYKCSLSEYSLAHSMETSSESIDAPFYPSIITADSKTCHDTGFKQYDETAARRSFEVFKRYSLSSFVDVVVCSFYPAECINYVSTNKTILFLPAHRFLLLLCSDQQIRSAMFWMFYSGLSSIHVMAMGRYDREYINYYTGLDVPFIYPSSFLEYSAPIEQDLVIDKVLIAPFHKVSEYYANVLSSLASQQHYNISFTTIKRHFNDSFNLCDLNHFSAVVVFPYAVLSYYLCDLIASSIPMLVPSRHFTALNMGLLSDYRNQDRYYCNGTASMPNRSSNSRHILSPEANTKESRYYWSQFASFYTPCTVVFDRMEDIPKLLFNLNRSDIYQCNLHYIEHMKRHNTREWKRFLRRVHHRTTANDYSDVLKGLNRNATYQ